MAYDADTLVDRRRLKRRLFLWRGLAILALVAVVVAAVGRFGGFQGGDYIARLSVDGVILDDPARIALIKKISDDSRVKALILRVNSPGGTVVGGEALYKSLLELGKNKPIVAVMGQIGTSAAYMIALASDRIFAHEGTITGSIGVILQTTEITGLLKKIGISAEPIKSGPLKAVPNPLEPLTPAVRKASQTLVNDMYDMFLDMVAVRRKLSKAEARTLSDGRVYTGRMAVKNGLIDQIGAEDEALAWLERERKISKTTRIRDVKVPRPGRGLLDRLDSLARKTVLSERLTLDGVISVWHPEAQ